ncbi:unnamed protein product [Meloidogyne enterolobii]|uniref:Uncharacterized protein n=1 Tax=Meloidogyne enterolobii TaxID=390850 RepID=A0ACB0YP41_MELEN
MTTANSNKYTNFRMDRLLRDSQSENILPQQQPQNNFWPYTQNFSPIQQQSFPLNSQQQYLNSFQFPSPPFYNLSPNFSTLFSPPPSSLNTNPFLTAFLTSLFQKQFILNQLQKQQITSIFQQNTPPVNFN